MNMSAWFRLTIVLAAWVAAAMAFGQPATAEQRGSWPLEPGKYATMHLVTKLGSFKMMNAEGRATIRFTGTLMINNYQGKPLVVQGNLRREYNENNRQIYFGTGTIVLDGKWRGAQWFGRDMRAVWYGKGEVRVSGEFDENLETGWAWYDDPSKRQAWFAQGTFTLFLPAPINTPGTGVVPRERVRN